MTATTLGQYHTQKPVAQTLFVTAQVTHKFKIRLKMTINIIIEDAMLSARNLHLLLVRWFAGTCLLKVK